MITKKIKSMEVKGEFNHIQIAEEIIEIEDNVLIKHELNHRRVISPGCDYENEHADIKGLCALFHTEELVKAYKDSQVPE